MSFTCIEPMFVSIWHRRWNIERRLKIGPKKNALGGFDLINLPKISEVNKDE